MATIIGRVLGQTEAPEPLLPDSGGAIWSTIAVLALTVLVLAVIAWQIWKYLRDTRRTADQAMQAVSDLRSEIASSER